MCGCNNSLYRPQELFIAAYRLVAIQHPNGIRFSGRAVTGEQVLSWHDEAGDVTIVDRLTPS